MRDKIIIPINGVEVYIHNPIQKSIYNQRVEILYYDNKIMKLNCILNDKTIFLDPGEIIIWKDLLEQAKFTKNKMTNFNTNEYPPIFIEILYNGELIAVKIPKREQIIHDGQNKMKKVFINSYNKRTKRFIYHQDGILNEVSFDNLVFHKELLNKALLFHKKKNKKVNKRINKSIYQNEKNCMRYDEDPIYDKYYNRNFNIRRENYISDNHEESIDDYEDFLKEKDDLNSSRKYNNEYDLNFNNKRKYDFIDDNLENLNKKKKEL